MICGRWGMQTTSFPTTRPVSTGRINTLFSLFHQEKKEIREAVQSWNTRNLVFLRWPPECCQGPMTTGTVSLNTVAVMRRFSARAGLKLTA